MMDNKNNDKINSRFSSTWKDKGFDANLQRPFQSQTRQAQFIRGASFDALLDDLLFNRMIRLKDLRVIPQGNDPGKIYWDGENKKAKIWVNEIGGWADLVYTSTSTSTTSSSTSSTSISTSSTSSSSSSSSTSTTI